MKESFIPKKFSPDSENMISTINGILRDYATQGYDLSLRQLYYQLVSRNLVPNTEASYKSVGSLVSDGRLAGRIDWNMIKDRGRETISNPHWESPGDFLESVAGQFKLDLWEGQENYVEVMVEKQALEGVLEPVCRGLDIAFTANKGYSSSSALYETSKRYIEAREQGKLLHVIYLGDHDPSGIDMSRDVEERLDLFVKTSMDEGHLIDPNEPSAVQMHRIALNMTQIRTTKPALPENPAKLTDSRAKEYIKNFGTKSWELDAIEPRRLAEMVTDAVESLLDLDLYESRREKMMSGRKDLKRIAREYEG